VEPGRYLHNFNPASAVQRLHINPYEKAKGLSPEQARAMLKGCDRATVLGARDHAILSFYLLTARRRADILDSRIAATTTLVEAMTRATKRPTTFVSGSAVGFYGSRGDEILTEQSAHGSGFLADVCLAWEDAAFAAPKGVRVVVIRTGLVLAGQGALAPLRLLTRLCVAGPLAGGRAWWPWVSLNDEVRAIVHLLTSRLSGPINVVGPAEATSRTVMATLASAMRRPFWLPAPGWAIRLLLGRAGNELLLASQRVHPIALEADGFVFTAPTVAQGIDQALS
jgi:uncharacterized protein (TIGR01777 family)